MEKRSGSIAVPRVNHVVPVLSPLYSLTLSSFYRNSYPFYRVHFSLLFFSLVSTKLEEQLFLRGRVSSTVNKKQRYLSLPPYFLIVSSRKGRILSLSFSPFSKTLAENVPILENIVARRYDRSNGGGREKWINGQSSSEYTVNGRKKKSRGMASNIAYSYRDQLRKVIGEFSRLLQYLYRGWVGG